MIYRLFFVCVVVLGLLSACDAEPDDGWLTGYAEADLRYISAPASGWLREQTVVEGEMVAPGQGLYQLDNEQQLAALAAAQAQVKVAEADLRNLATGARAEELAVLDAQVSEARASLDYAYAERRRWRSLGSKGVATPEEVLQAETAYTTARADLSAAEANRAVADLPARDDVQAAAAAQLEAATASARQLQWQLDQRGITATAAGVVEAVYQHEGEYVTTGTPLLALMPADAIKVRFFVPQGTVGQLHPGDKVQLRSDADGNPFEGSVSFIATQAEFTPPVIYRVGTRDKLLFMVEAKPDAASSLRPGVPVDVKLP